MADIFISYKKTDGALVRPIVDLLQGAGWSVWWDTRLDVGEEWDLTIEREIMAAGCVVVIWSPDSTSSYWVREEARVGREREALIPVLIRGASLPFGYGLLQAIDFTNWRSNSSADCAAKLARAIELKIGPPGAKPIQQPATNPLRPCAIRLSMRLLATTMTLFAANGLFIMKLNYAVSDWWWTSNVFSPLPFLAFGILFLLSIPNIFVSWNARPSQVKKRNASTSSRLSVFRQATLWLAAERPGTPSYVMSFLLVAIALFPTVLSPNVSDLYIPWLATLVHQLPSWADGLIVWGWPTFIAALVAVASVADIAIRSQMRTCS